MLGITTVAGNVPLALTSTNAAKVCELAGRPDVPVYAGCDRPLVRDLVTAEYIHGKTGLDGADLPEPSVELQPEHAVDYLIDTLVGSDDASVTLCPLGPLTNIATAIARQPRILPKIREIVLMGGGFFEGGNATPAAEFNIYVDPQAAAAVLGCGRPVTMLPLDVTHKALITPPRIERFVAMGTPPGDTAAGLMDFFERYDVDKYGSEGGPLHDPCVIAYLLNPELFGGRRVNVEVEVGSELTMGMTVVDWWGVTDRPPNATWITDIDADAFFALLVERIGSL